MSKKTLFFLIVLFFIFAFFIFDWLMARFIHNRKELAIPNITGKSVVDALGIISQYNLSIKQIATEFHTELPRGTITRQDPFAGMLVREGKIIKVTISQGSELIFVPDLVGLASTAAEILLRKNQLNLGSKMELYSLKYDRDRVISQDPPANTILNKDTFVNITVSLGKPPEGILLIPDFTGKNINELVGWCNRNNIKYETVEQNSPQPSGTIINQEPVADTIIFVETIVKTTIAKGIENVPATDNLKGNVEQFFYEVPSGTKSHKVRILLMDVNGEREIYSNILSGGTKISIPISKKGNAKIRIYLNNILVEEREL